MPYPLHISSGGCWVSFAFDVGAAVDLAQAKSRLPPGHDGKYPAKPGGEAAGRSAGGEQPAAEQATGPHRVRPGPLFRPEPLRTAVPIEPVSIGRWATSPWLHATIFDFGAVSLAYRIDLRDAGWDDLCGLAVALDEAPALLADARRRAAELIASLGQAVTRPHLADIAEDYIVFRAESWSFSGAASATGASGIPGPTPAEALRASPSLAAQVLRASKVPLSSFEVEDAALHTLGYEPGDLTVIDWRAALVFDADAADLLAVLEYANVELLEMRFLDDRLDDILDRSYAVVSRRGGLLGSLPGGSSGEERRRLAALQMENALLFEGINNAIKLVGDQYLSRVYRAATKRFHLGEWDASVLRKLDTLQSLYEKLADAQTTRRMEILEWIIIVLIAVSILLPFVGLAGH